MVISHPDQSVRAAKIFESFGYEVDEGSCITPPRMALLEALHVVCRPNAPLNVLSQVAVPDFQGTPWTVFGCDDVGYTNATAVRHTSSREQYIRYELNMRARQVDDGSLFF